MEVSKCFWSLKLSNGEPGQLLDGRPAPGTFTKVKQCQVTGQYLDGRPAPGTFNSLTWKGAKGGQ